MEHDRGPGRVKVVGNRRPPLIGGPPSDATRWALTRMAAYRTRVPKGVFVYRSHEEANRDWDRWTVDAIIARKRHG